MCSSDLAERRLAAEKAARQHEWSAGHPGLESLGESVRRLEAEVRGLRQLLSRHGIDAAAADLPEAGQEEA